MKSDNKPEAPQKPKRRPFHEEFAEKIIAHLKAGTASWQQPWHPGKTLAAPHNPASGTVYRGMNRVHLALSGYEDPRWMTLRQANDNGLRILPGSKATPVVYFQFTKEQDRIGEDGKPVLGEDDKPQKQTVELDKPIIRFAHVFNAERYPAMPTRRCPACSIYNGRGSAMTSMGLLQRAATFAFSLLLHGSIAAAGFLFATADTLPEEKIYRVSLAEFAPAQTSITLGQKEKTVPAHAEPQPETSVRPVEPEVIPPPPKPALVVTPKPTPPKRPESPPRNRAVQALTQDTVQQTEASS